MTSARQIYLGSRRKPRLPYDAEVEYLESTGTQYIYVPLGIDIVSPFNFTLRSRFTRVPDSSFYGTGFTTGVAKQFFYALSSNANNGLYMCFNGATDIARNLSAGKTTWHEVSARTQNGRVVYSLDDTQVADNAFVSFAMEYFALFCIANPLGTISGNIGAQQISSCSLVINGIAIFDLVPVRFTNGLGQSEGAMYDRVSGRLFRNAGTGAFSWAEKSA